MPIPLSKLDPNLPLKLAFYAAPGLGKTFLAAQAADIPSLTPVLLIDIDQGSRTLLKKEGSIPDITIPKNVIELNEILLELDPARNSVKYKTIILDTVGAMYDVCLLHNSAKDLIDRQTYGRVNNYITRFVTTLISYGYNIILLLHEKKIDGDEKIGVDTTITFDVTGGLTNKIIRQMDAVFRLLYITKNNVTTRYLQTKPTSVVVTKTRLTELPAFIANPTLENIINLTQQKEEPNS